MSIKPRVIAAEIKKGFKDVTQDKNISRPHIAGVLSLVGGVSSEPHWAEVRCGCLMVYPGCVPLAPKAPGVWRLPLRHLHLLPAPSGRPRGFSLKRNGETSPIATFQVDNESDYSRWVKTLAAELLKQTPLEAVKFLDILGITASIPLKEPPSRSLSPDYHSEPETISWGMRCSPLPRVTEVARLPQTAPKNWFNSAEVSQPLSLIITEEPKLDYRNNSFRKALNFDPPKDAVDGRFRVVDSLCQLAKQSKNCFSRSWSKPEHEKLPKYHSLCEDTLNKNKFKSLPKTYRVKDNINEEVTKPNPLHPLDMKDDGRTGRPPLPDVVRDLPPCDRRSRDRTRVGSLSRPRGKSVDVLPSTEDHRVAELMARCRQEDRYVPVRDKRLLFETLGRAVSQPRFVLSSDNLTDLGEPPPPDPPRTQSLHDLSTNNVAVKEICRYFEQRGGSRGEVAPRSPSPECRLSLAPPTKGVAIGPSHRQLIRAERRLSRLRQHIAECEATTWRLRDQCEKLAINRRGSSSRVQEAVESRLVEERERLQRLRGELAEAERAIDPTTSDHYSVKAAKLR